MLLGSCGVSWTSDRVVSGGPLEQQLPSRISDGLLIGSDPCSDAHAAGSLRPWRQLTPSSRQPVRRLWLAPAPIRVHRQAVAPEREDLQHGFMHRALSDAASLDPCQLPGALRELAGMRSFCPPSRADGGGRGWTWPGCGGTRIGIRAGLCRSEWSVAQRFHTRNRERHPGRRPNPHQARSAGVIDSSGEVITPENPAWRWSREDQTSDSEHCLSRMF